MRKSIPEKAIKKINTLFMLFFGQIEEVECIISRWDAPDLEYLDKLLPSGMPTQTHL